MQMATEAQLNLISKIERLVDEQFTGRTKREASDYIERNYDEFKELEREERRKRRPWNR